MVDAAFDRSPDMLLSHFSAMCISCLDVLADTSSSVSYGLVYFGEIYRQVYLDFGAFLVQVFFRFSVHFHVSVF